MPPPCQLLSGRPVIQHVAVRTCPTIRRTYATHDPTPVVKNPLRRRRGGDLGSHLPKHVIPSDAYIPAYPYGDHALFKQANRGLYGEQMIQFGNNVSDKTETKTRRYWKPNVLSKSLYSVALKKKIKLRITSKVLKVVDREGGLDEYLLKDSEHRLKELGPLGWALRWTLMQKPKIIDRMRAQAAALGLDQATIDKQWPTPQMLTEQRASQSGLVRAADLVGEDEYYDVDEGTEEGSDVYDPALQGTYTREERRAMFNTGVEYDKAVKAAQRYLARQNVDSEEEGLKLAFIRAKERKEAGDNLRKNFAKKLEDQFSAQDIADTRTRLDLPPTLPDDAVRKITYNQWRRQQVEEAGSYEAWREKIDAEKQAALKPRLEQADDSHSASQSSKKGVYTKMIEEAETAATNMKLDAERRHYLQSAIAKADMAIKARASGGRTAYVESVIDESRQDHLSRTRSLREISRGSRQDKEANGDAWAALVNSSNRPLQSRPDA